ncbi:MAG TPA: 23S rRNA (uracil(1939)-C(5))-methyltransferase, partial [Magnetococcales bacterium]|nr:23S rRNA (uracil(1939)-C(5))-methyltransferase [Magnetococcales bacterium]
TVNMDLFSPKDLDMFGLYAPPDLILLDPPRVGAVEFCKRIDPFRPKRLIYVSCDPATFSRDAAILCHGGAQLQKVVPVDLFPQTHHVELVGIFAWE